MNQLSQPHSEGTLNELEQKIAFDRELEDFFESFSSERVSEEITDLFHKALACPESDFWKARTRGNKAFFVQRTIAFIKSMERIHHGQPASEP